MEHATGAMRSIRNFIEWNVRERMPTKLKPRRTKVSCGIMKSLSGHIGQNLGNTFTIGIFND